MLLSSYYALLKQMIKGENQKWNYPLNWNVEDPEKKCFYRPEI